MKKIVFTVLALAIAATGCSSANKDDVKANAPEVFAKRGFQIVAYEGYTFGAHVGPGYGGANVWYVIKRVPDNGIIYHAYVSKWGDEYHIYGLKAIDAIKPN